MPGQGLPFLYDGEVTRRDDPDGLGRVKVRIAGIVEPETPNWAMPCGHPGAGSAQHGHWEPPAVGANVIVFFKLGDVDYPRYISGPWGDPDGVSDVPENAGIDSSDGDRAKRHNAVTEDEAWRIERDSRNGGGAKHRYLIRHKDSDQAVLLDADADKVYIVREAAAQAFVRGTEYRAAEASALSSLAANLTAAGGFLNTAGTDVTLVSLAKLAAAALVNAGAQLTAAGNNLSSADLAASATAYLSDRFFGE